MGIQINGTTDTISAVDGSLDINQNATFGNNVTIGGTLTYSDVTNIDSVGLVTAKNGLRIHAGGIDLTSGISTFSDNIQIADKIIHKDDTDTAIRFSGADIVSVETAGSERFRVESGGGIGIGDSIYHLGDTNTQVRFSGADTIQLETGGSNRLKIDANGVVQVTRRLELTNSGDNHHVYEGRAWTWTSNGTSSGTVRAYMYGDSSSNLRIGTNGWNERVRINSGGQVSISGAGTTFGNNTLLNIAPANRTTAFAASDGDTWHDVVIKHGGDATNNAVGLAFEVSADAYHKNAGTGIAAIKNGTDSDYGSDLVFITRPQSAIAQERLRITSGGNVNIGGNYTQTTYTMRVTGSFAATTKSFVIDHPTKENHKLRYACLEGPENSVYIRGRSSDSVIQLPDYWVGLVHDDSITVNVTPIGNKKVWVESINNNSVTIGSDDSTEYFYTVFAERKDVEKLEVEVEN